jgi:hypothetical protein
MITAKVLAVLLAMASAASFGAEIPKAPVPPSPYLPVIYKFADAMLERGRDTNGLFFSALDRTTLAPLTNRPAAAEGVRQGDRIGQKNSILVGVNPEHDENLLRLLYTLSELSGKPKYRDAADAEVRWFVENQDIQRYQYLFVRPWMLWDRCFELAGEASRRMALPPRDPQFQLLVPRYAGYNIRTWAAAYAHTTNDSFLKAIDRIITGLNERRDPASAANVSLAIDCDAASRLVPEPLASPLRALADKEDQLFCFKPPDLKSTTSLWIARPGSNTTAQVGMMCISRYENTGKIAYRDLMHAAADAYLGSLPEEGADVWAATLGHAISLQLAAWRSTARQAYLDHARALGDLAIRKFFDGSVLPRASLKTQHYESITGVDTLALALVELHLHILHITAVRCPSNTIDR